ncbi:unnamed protein product [Periconia digitata]|uniref:Uncharacterized protein n=1 Tax=Periconia digitata TaxID=1303443 RepID=A0A9W4UIL6_9PLEO|nr:unnamed protein product [Periconia digitata]
MRILLLFTVLALPLGLLAGPQRVPDHPKQPEEAPKPVQSSQPTPPPQQQGSPQPSQKPSSAPPAGQGPPSGQPSYVLPPKPRTCQQNILPISPYETRQRWDRFVVALLYDKNVTTAFSYIVQDYVNHAVGVEQGFEPAWNFVSMIWTTQSANIIADKTWFNRSSDIAWQKYTVGKFNIVDRFRWDRGCIVEHVSWTPASMYWSNQ